MKLLRGLLDIWLKLTAGTWRLDTARYDKSVMRKWQDGRWVERDATAEEAAEAVTNWQIR